MAVQANWHLEDLDLPDVDAAVEIRAQLHTAPVIDLSGEPDLVLPSERIAVEFQALIAREAVLSSALYQECHLKWTVEADGGLRNPCRTCEMFCHDSSDPDSMLCSLGLQQEATLDAFRAARGAEGLDGDMLSTMEWRLDAAHELAEALL